MYLLYKYLRGFVEYLHNYESAWKIIDWFHFKIESDLHNLEKYP